MDGCHGPVFAPAIIPGCPCRPGIAKTRRRPGAEKWAVEAIKAENDAPGPGGRLLPPYGPREPTHWPLRRPSGPRDRR